MTENGDQLEIVTEIARPEDVLPTSLLLLPLDKKPFFPGQVLPVVLDAQRWGETLKRVHKAGHGAIGVVFVEGEKAEKAGAANFRRIGTVCKIHQFDQHDQHFHLVLAGMQRFEIMDWVSAMRLPVRR